jgi:protein TonB
MESNRAGILFKTKSMTSTEISKASFLDIIFENRNKAYGAYELRTHYNSRLGTALLTMFCIVLLIALVVQVWTKTLPGVIDRTPAHDPVILRVFDDPPPPPIEQPMAVKPPKTKMASEKFLDKIEIVPDATHTDIPDVEKLAIAAISDEQIDGTPSMNNEAVNVSTPKTGEDGEMKASELTSGFTAVEKTANFPGGQEAWLHFLNKHLRSPGELEAGQKRTVLVRFAVGIDGMITQFEFIQSGGASFDKEVLRVLKKMPAWEPAVQNGRHVSVMFTQPVTFMSVTE